MPGRDRERLRARRARPGAGEAIAAIGLAPRLDAERRHVQKLQRHVVERGGIAALQRQRHLAQGLVRAVRFGPDLALVEHGGDLDRGIAVDQEQRAAQLGAEQRAQLVAGDDRGKARARFRRGRIGPVARDRIAPRAIGGAIAGRSVALERLDAARVLRLDRQAQMMLAEFQVGGVEKCAGEERGRRRGGGAPLRESQFERRKMRGCRRELEFERGQERAPCNSGDLTNL